MANELMETTVAVLQSVVYKIDNTVAELAKTSGEITRLLIVHDARIVNLESGSKETITDVKELYKTMSDNTKQIIDKIDLTETKLEEKLKEHADAAEEQYASINKRISALENWRWVIIGGAVVVSYLLNNLDILKSI
jgi:hypothetical protein